MTDKEIRKLIMRRPTSVPYEDSIATTLGVLYEKKARGLELIRVLEDYRRFCSQRADQAARPHKLETLYLRRAAVDQVIRSIEAYTAFPPSSR
jgi:hypothetical protein